MHRQLRHILRNIDTFSRFALGCPLRPYQLEPARAILDSVMHRKGLTFTVMMARQAGKNQASAHIEAHLLTLLQRAGGTMVKAAPTWKPQIVTSMERLQAVLNHSPLSADWRPRWGYQIALGNARVIFFSADPTSNVVGATAHHLLEFDEAQDITQDKHDRDFAPMASTTNATRVYWGTAWNGETLLEQVAQRHRELERHDGIRRHFEYDWRHVAAANPLYGAYVDAERQRLGPDHPLFLTQYELRSVPATGHFLTQRHLELLHGDFPAQEHPNPEATYVFGIDVAGQSEAAQDAALRAAQPRRDSTVVTIAEVTWRPVPDPEFATPHQDDPAAPEHAPHPEYAPPPPKYAPPRQDPAPPHPPTPPRSTPHPAPPHDDRPEFHSDKQAPGGKSGFSTLKHSPGTYHVGIHEPSLRVVRHYWWTGVPHHTLHADLLALIATWQPKRVTIDATGLGYGLAHLLQAAHPSSVEPFLFTSTSKSNLAYSLLAAINSTRLQLYATPTPSSRELWHELRRAQQQVRPSKSLNFYVPDTEGHDDFLSSLALTVHAAGQLHEEHASQTIIRPREYEDGRY